MVKKGVRKREREVRYPCCLHEMGGVTFFPCPLKRGVARREEGPAVYEMLGANDASHPGCACGRQSVEIFMYQNFLLGRLQAKKCGDISQATASLSDRGRGGMWLWGTNDPLVNVF